MSVTPIIEMQKDVKLLSRFIEIQYLRHPQNLRANIDRSEALARIRMLLEHTEKELAIRIWTSIAGGCGEDAFYA